MRSKPRVEEETNRGREVVVEVDGRGVSRARPVATRASARREQISAALCDVAGAGSEERHCKCR